MADEKCEIALELRIRGSRNNIKSMWLDKIFALHECATSFFKQMIENE